MAAIDFLQIVLYILGSILLVILIVLGIRVVIIMNKVERLVDNINVKTNQLNGIFNIIDTTTNKINLFSDKIIEKIGSLIKKKINKKKKEDD